MIRRKKLEDSVCGDELQEFQQFLWPVDRLRQNSQQGKSLELICCLSKHIRKQKKYFVLGVKEKSLMLKELLYGKKNKMVVMVKWDEEFVESKPVTSEILMKLK